MSILNHTTNSFCPEQNNTNDSKESKESTNSKESNDSKESKESTDSKDSKDNNANNKDYKDNLEFNITNITFDQKDPNKDQTPPKNSKTEVLIIKDSCYVNVKWRVKLYDLNLEGRWDDKGTGFVFIII